MERCTLKLSNNTITNDMLSYLKYPIEFILDTQSKQITPKITSYKFRGEIDFNLLFNNCLEENSLGFIVITPTTAYMGCTFPAHIKVPMKTFPILEVGSFIVWEISKKDIGAAITFLKEETAKYKKTMKKLRKRIYKENNSNKPETKVMVFK